MKVPQLVLALVTALALAGGGFAAGVAVGKSGAAATAASPSPTGAAARIGPGGAAGRGALAGGQSVTAGRVLSVNDGSLTIELRTAGAQGASPSVSTQIVLVGSGTRVVRATEVDIAAADIKVNDQVQIVGSADASGSLSATAIVVGGSALQQLLGGRGTPAPSPTR